MSDSTKTLLKGAAILTFATFFTKLIGVIYRIPYQNITGDRGLYVYQQVYPIYGILLVVATAGFPIAISKLVSERLAEGDTYGAKRVFRISFFLLAISGILFFALLYAAAPMISIIMSDGEQLVMPIRTVALALLVVPMMSAIRGYYQGHQFMIPTAVSQVVEQIVRVATILILSYWFMYHQYDVYYAGSGAVFGAFTGGMAAFVVLMFFWRRVHRQQTDMQAAPTTQAEPFVDVRSSVASSQTADHDSADHFSKQGRTSSPTTTQIAKRLFYLAIPICLGSIVLPLFQGVDAFTVPRVLIEMGVPHELAENMKGVFDRGQPLIMFAAFFATSLSLALVPSISDAKARGDEGQIYRRSDIALKFTVSVGLAASFGLAVLAYPINIMMWRTDDGTLAIAVLAFTTIFSTISITTGAILQGMGHVLLPARNLAVGVVIKLIGNITLIPFGNMLPITYGGIVGAALATVIAYAVACWLNVRSVHKLLGVSIGWRSHIAKPAFSVAVMVLVVGIVSQLLLLGENVFAYGRFHYTFISLITVCIGAFVYGVALLRTGAVRRQEMAMLPRSGKIIAILERLRIMPKNPQ